MDEKQTSMTNCKPPENTLSEEQRKEIIRRLATIAEAVGQEVTPARMDTYLQCLSDLPFGPLMSALAGMLFECQWFPKIPEIRQAVLGGGERTEAEAEAAWLGCLKYANRWHPDCDPPKGVALSTSQTRSLRVAGGIYMLWKLQDEGGTEVAFMRKAFIESYKRRDAVDVALDEAGKKQIGEGMKSVKQIIGGMAETKQ